MCHQVGDVILGRSKDLHAQSTSQVSLAVTGLIEAASVSVYLGLHCPCHLAQ